MKILLNWQNIQYFNEVHQKLNPATIIFCVILENLTTEEIMKIHFENEGFYSILENNSGIFLMKF